jgi:hypothetical protein
MTTGHYARFVIGTIFALAAAVASFNVLVDARGLFGETWLAHVLGFAADYESRASRAELLHRKPWDEVVIGTSRVHVGIDPNSPVFADRRVLNLGLPDTNLCEMANVATAVAAQPGITRAYWFVEFELFDQGCRTAVGAGASRFDPGLDRVEYVLENALGYRATLETIERVRQVDPVWTDSTGAMHEMRPLADPERAARALLRSSHRSMPSYVLSHEKIDRFEDSARALLAAGIDLLVVYSPVHASMLEIQRIGGLEDDAEVLLRALTLRIEALSRMYPDRRVELWDFSGYHGDSISPLPMTGGHWLAYRDPSHFRPGLGARVIGAMRDGGRDPASPDRLLGFRLTAADIEVHLARKRSERAEYAARHGDEIDQLQAILDDESEPAGTR